MIKIVQPRYVLAVRDLQRSATYYREKLGFATDWAHPGWEQLSRGNFVVMLGECADDVDAFDTRNHSYFAYVQVDGIDALYDDFAARGANPWHPPIDRPWGMREFGITTVDGHRVMFGSTVE